MSSRAEPAHGVSGPLAGLSICLVGINYAPEQTGIAPYTTATAVALRDAGATVRVITGVPHYPRWEVTDEKYSRGNRWEEIIDGISVTRVRHHVPSRANLTGRARMEASFFRRANLLVRADRSDVLVAVTPSLAGLAAAVIGAKGRPVAAIVQDLTGNAASQSGAAGALASRVIAAGEYALLRRAAVVGVITPGFSRTLGEHGITQVGDVANFSHIVPVNLDRASARALLGWSADLYTVVHTGNMGLKQGLEVVVEAALLSREAELGINFVLLGDGNQRRSLIKAAKDNPAVTIMEPVSSELYPVVLAAADALLISERAGVREMSLPSKLTSYVRASRPIIAALDPEGLTHEVIARADAGILIPAGSAGAMIEAAQRLRDDPTLSARYVSNAEMMHREHYTPAAARKRYVNLAIALKKAL